jgi:hypothetical protein
MREGNAIERLLEQPYYLLTNSFEKCQQSQENNHNFDGFPNFHLIGSRPTSTQTSPLRHEFVKGLTYQALF